MFRVEIRDNSVMIQVMTESVVLLVTYIQKVLN